MRTRLAVAAILTFGTTIAPRSGAQTAAYRPGFRVRHYDIAIDVPDSGATIHADATLTVERTAPRDTLVLDLLDLTVARVAVNGKAAVFRQTPAGVAVVLPAARVGDTTQVEVEYGGAVTDGLIARRDSAGRWTYFGDNWPDRARHWIPSLDHPSDKATVTWRVRASPAKTVVANGALVSTRPVADGQAEPRTEWVWRESRPIPTYLMVIAAAPLVRYEYGGAVTDGLIARRDSAGRWTYFGDNWPDRARHWIPSLDHPRARTGRIAVRVRMRQRRRPDHRGEWSVGLDPPGRRRAGRTAYRVGLARVPSDPDVSHGHRRGAARTVRPGRNGMWPGRRSAVRAAVRLHRARTGEDDARPPAAFCGHQKQKLMGARILSMKICCELSQTMSSSHSAMHTSRQQDWRPSERHPPRNQISEVPANLGQRKVG